MAEILSLRRFLNVFYAGKTRVRFDPMELASFIETLLVNNSLLIKEENATT